MPNPYDLPPSQAVDDTAPVIDKREHALSGAAVRLGAESLLPEDAPRFVRMLAPNLAAMGVGVGKEFFDMRDVQHHTPDARDAVATALGSALSYHDDRHGLTIVPTLSPDMVALDLLLRF